MLFQELGKVKRSWIMTSIVMIVIGFVMILCPVRYVGMLISALGYVLLVLATYLVLAFLESKKVLINYAILTGGLIVGLLGIFVLVRRRDVLPVLGLVFGLVLVVEGIRDIFNAFMYVRRSGRKGWWVLAILSALTIVFGVMLLLNPWWNSPLVLKRVIGVMVLFSSVVSIIRVVLTWPIQDV